MTSHELVDKIGGCEDRDFAIALLNAYVKVKEAEARLDEIKHHHTRNYVQWRKRQSELESCLDAAPAELKKIR